MTYAYVQSASARNTTAGPVASQAVSLVNPVSLNNLIVIGLTWGSVSTIENLTSFLDNLGNVYTRVPNCNRVDSTNQQQQTVYYAVVTAPGTPTITATFLANRDNTGIAAVEYSGGATSGVLDASTANFQASPGTGTDAVSSGNVTTIGDGELVFGVYTDCSAGAGTTVTAGTNFNLKREDTGGGGAHAVQIVVEDRMLATAGQVAATFTEALNHRALASVATFVPAGGVTSVLLPPPIIGLQR